jgi:hypothetical protein
VGIFQQDFIVWGLVVIYLLIQVAYLIWMNQANRGVVEPSTSDIREAHNP